MTTFENFYHDLLELAEKYQQQNIPLKIEVDLENDAIKIFGEKITSLARAKNGLADISELAHATAEHHPYWNLLSNCSDIADTVLERWNDSMSFENMSDIDWALKNLNDSIEKIKTKQQSSNC